MNYIILLFIVIGISLLSFFLMGKDIFHPIVISTLCYAVSIFFCIIMIPFWQYDITVNSIVVVTITFLSILIFSLVANKLAIKIELKKYNGNLVYINDFSQKKKTIVFLIAILFAISIIKNYYDIAYKFGFEGAWYEITKISMAAKNANLSYGAQLLRINTYMQYFLKGITYCAIFVFFYNIMRCKKDIKSNLHFVLFTIPYLLVIYVSGWRTDFLFILVFTLMMIGLNIDKANFKLKNYIRYILILFVFFIVALSLWIFTAIIRYDDSFNFYDVINYISTYIGGGIVNFDQYLNGAISFPASNVFGKRVFVNIYSYLNRLHLTNVSFPSSVLPMGGVLKTNIYSGLFRGYDDFGLMGNCLYLGIIFFVYSFIYTILSKYKNLHFLSILYAYHCYPICLLGVEEAFSIFFISTMPFYVIFFYGITYYFMIHKSIKQGS